jgi:leucine dehydrogenase
LAWTTRELPADGVHRVLRVDDPPSGLRAFIVLDDLRLGPAAGGVRTRAYGSEEEALVDARSLARAMTQKCALAGLGAGGGKAVVIDHGGLDRPRAFAVLGEVIQSLDGAFRTAGDVGTTAQDLAAMGETCQWVHGAEGDLASSVARGLLAAMAGALDALGLPPMDGRTAAVQGAGSIGAAVTRALRTRGLRVLVSDLDSARVEALTAETGAEIRSPHAIFGGDASLILPCALGGIIDRGFAETSRSSLVCGGANNILATDDVEEVLMSRGIGFVPDVISSAGAVIDGIGASVMGLADREPLIAALETLSREVVAEARRSGRTTIEVAAERAAWRLAHPGGDV